MKNLKEQAEALDTLLHRCNDSMKGYEKAADAANQQSLKLHLHNIALERKDFSRSILGHMKQMGAEGTDSGTVAGALHRNWLDLKAVVSSATEESILKECQRGDERLVEDYVDTITKSNLPKQVENDLARQLSNVQDRLARMEQMTPDNVH